jgi:signal transduction histidine kinase
MKLCFYQRLALSIVVVFMLVLAGFFWATEQLQSQTKQEAEQKLHLELAAHLVGDNPLLQKGVYDYEALKNLFHTLMILGPNFEFYYLDHQGNILTYSAPEGKVKRDRVELTPLLDVINGSKAYPVLGDDPRDPSKQKIFSAAPVYNNDQLQGYLYVIIGGEAYDSILAGLQKSQYMREFVLFIVSGLIVLLVALLGLFRFFTAPLRRLSEDMLTIKAADFRRRNTPQNLAKWNSKSSNEVHILGCAFTEMLIHIDNQFEQLQQIDSERRILLADLSHDLRTPLANLQGYIETLALNSDSLSAADRNHFVNISLRNAKNLKRLVDQIFELAYLEGGQITLHQEQFPLGDLLHDVAAKFALKTTDKNISLSVKPDQFEYQIFADIGKLERVLTNLLENAIRHTPEYGQIRINVSAPPNLGEDKLRVDIRDSGIGISDTEIAFIFDARYQASNTQSDNSLHAGLGLAISRKLMALLESDLVVESQLGKGTCFSFELKIAK